jgi:hypothetical protein
MPFADSPAGVLTLIPLIFALTVGFIIGDLVGLLPFFLARWKRRSGLGVIALLGSGVAGAVFLPAAVAVAAVFTVVALVIPRRNPQRDIDRQAAAIYKREQAADPGPRVALASERFLQR